jgi:rod shape-determining protein MreC
VILITDPEHAVPVRVERTGLRTIAVGAGDTASLALPYLPGNADIKSGDLLVSSGLGGVFPEGYPVARVTEVHRDAVQPLAQVRAEPLAHVDTDSEVMLVWFRADHPAAPAPAAGASGELKGGNPAMQPQATAPKSRATPQAAPPAPPAPRSEPSRPLPTQATAATHAPTPGGNEERPGLGAPAAGAPATGVPATDSPPAAAAVPEQGQP